VNESAAATLVTAALALIGTGYNALSIYRAANRAAVTTERVAGISLYESLTNDQRSELDRYKVRLDEAEEKATECLRRVDSLSTYTRSLYLWASTECPHDQPPPQPPIGLL
jgi:hypothetical protein